MKIIIFSGNHPRHLFIHQEVVRFGADCAAIVMEREQLLPAPPPDLSQRDKQNFERHFKDRFEVEKSAFGELSPERVFAGCKIHYCTPPTLNSESTVNFIKAFQPDIAFIFGTDLIKAPVLPVLPEIKVNLHLGLSPWYRGSATLFWPFYFLQPQFAGATFHQILPEADAGGILHQSVPVLSRGDGIHDVGVKTVLKAKEDFGRLLAAYGKYGWTFEEQKSSGRLFLTRDFQPAHLRIIYDTFNNDIVDAYLDGALEKRVPKLVLNKLAAG